MSTTEARIATIESERFAARAAGLFRAWGLVKLANKAAARRRELRSRKARNARYNHQ
jgi:hypothetical protein